MKVQIGKMVALPKAMLSEGLDTSQQHATRKVLTIVPKQTSDVGEARENLILYQEDKTHLYVPREWYRSFVTKQHEEILQVSYGLPMSEACKKGGFQGSNQPPYDEQVQAAETMLNSMKGAWGGGILQASCAFGKTATSLRIAYQHGKTTLVIVNKEFFMKQWTEEINFFLPGAKVGYIQGSTCDVKGKDIVIAMVHSLSQKEYPEYVYSYFGLVIGDEIHRVGSELFSKVIPQFSAAYRIGLSATPRRKDGCEAAYLWNIGPVLYKAKSQSMIPTVMLVTGMELPPLIKWGKSHSVDQMNSSQLDTLIGEQVEHNQQCMRITLRACEKGRKVMLVSTRMDQLAFFYTAFKAQKIPYTVGWVTGAMPQMDAEGNLVYGEKGLVTKTPTEEQIQQGMAAQIMLATKQLIEEGWNNPALDTMIMAMPQSDIEQQAGRARRFCLPNPSKCQKLCPWRAGICQGKPEPVIVDIVHQNRRLHGKLSYRLKYYQEIGAKLIPDAGIKQQYRELFPAVPPSGVKKKSGEST